MAIGNLTKVFLSPQALRRRLAQPERLLVAGLVERADGELRAIQTILVKQTHRTLSYQSGSPGSTTRAGYGRPPCRECHVNPVPAQDTETHHPAEEAGSVGTVQTQRVTLFHPPDPLELECKRTLGPIDVAYETYGRLDPARDNAVLICHALSGDAHVAGYHAEADHKPGWWDVMVGPGKGIDTDRYFVICSNILGGCRGTTGPSSVNPETDRPWGLDFPVITIEDMVKVQARLMDHLGIDKLLAVIGGSMGGMQVLEWTVRYPDRVVAAIPIATTSRLNAQSIAFDAVGRNAILADRNFEDGQYHDGPGPDRGLAIARMVGHITYLSRESMTAKFDADRHHPREVATEFEKEFNIGSYLAYQGDKFVERFDANSYITLSMAMDLFNLGATTEQLRANLSRAACRWLIVSFTSDWLFPAEQSRELVDALIAAGQPVSYCNITSEAGHDTFLLEDNLDVYGGMLGGFLLNRLGVDPSVDQSVDDDCGSGDPTSIFHRQRLDRLGELKTTELEELRNPGYAYPAVPPTPHETVDEEGQDDTKESPTDHPPYALQKNHDDHGTENEVTGKNRINRFHPRHESSGVGQVIANCRADRDEQPGIDDHPQARRAGDQRAPEDHQSKCQAQVDGPLHHGLLRVKPNPHLKHHPRQAQHPTQNTDDARRGACRIVLRHHLSPLHRRSLHPANPSPCSTA